MTGISSRPSKDSDGAEEQKRHHGEHHQMPWLKQVKQITHSDTLGRHCRTQLARRAERWAGCGVLISV